MYTNYEVTVTCNKKYMRANAEYELKSLQDNK